MIARTLRIIREHPSVVSVQPDIPDGSTGAWVADIEMSVSLPNAWMADGQSPAGVRAIEPVRLRFPPTFPLRPPAIQLRPDFNRSLAHVQPGNPVLPPEPCIVDGSLAELLHEQGLPGILNQLSHWLDNAALDRLIDPAQGWEPVRRDDLPGFVVADATYLRGLVSRDAGAAVFGFEYLLLSEEGGDAPYIHGEIGKTQLRLNRGNAANMFGDRSSRDIRVGQSVAIVAWPSRLPSGELVIANRYQPETVTDLAGLKARASAYGCAGSLTEKLNWLKTCLSSSTYKWTVPLAIVLCVRRPYPLIGTDSVIELCPYIINVAPPRFALGDRTPVVPVGHRHAVTVPLLRRMSGDTETEARRSWILAGCGSLGSKIALHLARAGRAPETLIDRGHLSPHNAARHGLIPDARASHLQWVSGKAQALADAIEGLGQTSAAEIRDVISVSRSSELARKILPKKSWALLNTTASLTVREALGSIPKEIEIPRVIETSLFANGRLGFLSVEGPGHNPNTLDLVAEAYAVARADDRLLVALYGTGASISRRTIGEGCGSATMAMTDARISMFAAPMAEAIQRMQTTSLPEDGGRLLIGDVADDGLGMCWSDHHVPPVLMVETDQPDGWTVRMADRAARLIAEDVGRWPNVETGGILMGRISEAARTFYVIDVLPAPADSARSPHEFVLGTQGARKAIGAYAESCNYSLFCLGTWHSHLSASGPSATDRVTADAVALARLAPSILLIHTPTGYRALVADAAEAVADPSEDI